MPIYLYQCSHGHRFQRFLPVKQHTPTAACDCGQSAEQILTAPTLVTIQPDICYDSPIDGRPITSWDARQEDLKRNGCFAYDPEQKTDYLRKQRESEQALDQSIEGELDRSIAKLSGDQRRRLANEMLDGGLTCEVERSTPHVA